MLLIVRFSLSRVHALNLPAQTKSHGDLGRLHPKVCKQDAAVRILVSRGGGGDEHDTRGQNGMGKCPECGRYTTRGEFGLYGFGFVHLGFGVREVASLCFQGLGLGARGRCAAQNPNSKPETRNPKPLTTQTTNHKPQTPNPTRCCQGLLCKRGDRWMKKWVDRRVLLQCGILSYFKLPSAQAFPRGQVRP